ncbi:hypothetical protein EVJ58_g2864 [Rhodofomes roseus]|uniref:Uncharacterized protein n=1 Tax=Rhodofomes roseus TaxID=34475 RepID=A0A4Y9YQU6_9APHY|nr:hypothetical protein EVJ58_g2864 [Rhodofomes roseus]
MPTSSLRGAVPWTAWKGNGRKPDVSYFHAFGCLAHVLVQKKDCKAMQPHTRKCIFVGYPEGTKAWQFWDPAARKFTISSHAVFDKRCFPGNLPFINVFGLPLDKIDVSGPADDKGEPAEDVPDAQELHDQGGDDSDDPAPPAPRPQNPLPLPQNARENFPDHPARPPSPPAPLPPAPAPLRPAARRQMDNYDGYRPYPAPSHRLPARSTCFQGSLNNNNLQRRNLLPQHFRVGSTSPASTPEPGQRAETPQRNSPSPDPLMDAPLSPPAAVPAPLPEPVSPPSPTSSDDELDFLHERGKWLKAAQDEVQSLVQNGTFELVQLPPGRKAIGSQWVFRVKRNADGSIERYKGRLVAKGFSQRPGFDYNETFAPTPKWASIRAILVLAALEDLELESVDIFSAYLNGELKEEVYMQQPEGFEQKTPDWVWRLLKALYGLKQAVDFAGTRSCTSVWVYLRDGVRIIIPVFVDDITIAAKSKAAIQRVKDDLRMHFKLRDLGPTSWLLGVKIERDRTKHSLSISQQQYALDVLERYGFANCDPVSTPMEPGLHLSAEMAPKTLSEVREMQNIPYDQAVGSLFYLGHRTHMGNLGRFTKNPGMTHWKAVKHLFRYIKGSLDYKLTYSPASNSELFASYTDADHAGCPDTGRSISGYVIKMGTGAISWSSHLQTIVALSTTEAEFVAAVSAGQEFLWLRNLLTELGFDVSLASKLRIDSLSTLSIAKNFEHHGCIKHLDLRFYWLKDEVAKGRIEIIHLRTSDMPADILTKSLAKPKVLEMVKMLGLGT